MNGMLIDIIVVSYNTAEFTLRALSSVYQETRSTPFNLIVVDNNSDDDSVQQIEENFPSVHLIKSSENLGFAGGVNLAAKHIKGKYVLLLNPDTIVLERAIDKLVKFAEDNPKNGIWGGITLNNDFSINSHNAWSEENIQTLLFSAFGLNRIFKNSCFFNKANYGCWKRDTVKEIDILQGSFFLSSTKLWQQLGGLDDTFFMYAEEADYCYRARELGYQPIVSPDIKIIHHGGESEPTISGKVTRLLTGKVTFIEKHHSLFKQYLMKGLLLLYVTNKMLIAQALAMLLRSPKRKTLASEWHIVFKNSIRWLKGY